ncbi:MAG TPA: TAT-variant-translocated molybdopterin oxidoreductase [Thermoanaerobaculia bacterium]|nr:TAT-variant-translocated molybdopterin oxidoreductase [Thermoanaerobaculia bacterium]
MSDLNPYLDIATFRARLDAGEGRDFWRSIEELSLDPEAFDEFLHREFPQESSALSRGVDRRDFLRLMGASLALGGLAACSPREAKHLVPYVNAPEDVIPGRPLFFATAMTLGGSSTGLLVETHMGRPTKIEGNPQHPSSLGGTDPFSQAAILGLYDPDRSQTLRYLGDTSTWESFQSALQGMLAGQKVNGGGGVRVLSESIVSPTLASQVKTFLTLYPKAQWHQYEPAGNDNVMEGSRAAFGSYANTVYRFDKAKVVVALDADMLSCGSGHLRYARDFMSARRVRREKQEMNRLYSIESMLTATGSVADHRLPLRSSDIDAFARGLAGAVGLGGAATASAHGEFIAAVARDLQAARGASIVIAGDHQPPAVHALAHAINAALGNVGQTVYYTAPLVESTVNQNDSLRRLVADMNAGRVETLLILGGNPAFNAPGDLRFAKAMDKVGFRAHLSLYYDETSERSHWHIPQAHFLEEWSDARSFDGTVSIVQPMIAPLYGGRSQHEILAILAEDSNEPYEIVRNFWRTQMAGDFDATWQKSLNAGFISGSVFPQMNPGGAPSSATAPAAVALPKGELELVFKPDPMIHDGRFANNGWLQELPKPMTKLTWDNAALMSPATAARLAVSNEQVLELRRAGLAVEAPVWIVPGHADDSITVYFGHGRSRAGKVGTGTGFNAYAIRTSDSPWIGRGVEVRKTGAVRRLACTQLHQYMEGRDIVRSGTIEQFRESPRLAPEGLHDHQLKGPSFYPDMLPKDGYAWGMSIDTSVCTGCNGCVIACQAENNIAVVGKKEMLIGREMHWLRIDHYFKGSPENPEGSYNIPVPCMHCENAPCEPVCPVEATTHSPEGINEMTYNRCVGTKYCSNNCPYKVRRFNFFDYSDYKTESLKPMRNPDVTVRSRGVMEKCTFCVQRVNEARINAEVEGRTIRDGEVTTACQSACPTQAIVFGNIHDKKSQVSLAKAEPGNYGLLAELNTQPRVTYLPTVRNPNRELAVAGHSNVRHPSDSKPDIGMSGHNAAGEKHP